MVAIQAPAQSGGIDCTATAATVAEATTRGHMLRAEAP